MSKARHPYERYEQEPAWRVLERAVKALAGNGDIAEQTDRRYIVGYLAKALVDAGFEQVSELRTGERTIRVVEIREGNGRRRAGVA